MRFLLKTLISALLIAGVTELGKRSSLLASILAALPVTSILVLCWIYLDTGDQERVARFSVSIFWALIPSFVFLLSLPWLLRRGMGFGPAMGLSCGLMAAGYWGYFWALGKLGVSV